MQQADERIDGLTRRMAETDMVDIVTETAKEVKVMEANVWAMVEDMKSAGKAEGAKKSTYRKHKEPRTFVPQNKGAEAQFKSWAFVFAGHLEGVMPGMESFLEWASKQEDELDTDDALANYTGHGEDEFDAIAASKVIYDELRGLCPEGEPQTAVRNSRAGKRGAEAWRKITLRYDPKGMLVAQGLTEQIQAIVWPKTTTGVHDMLEQLRSWALEYESITGKSYPEESLRGRVMAIMPDPYKAHIRNNLKTFKTWPEIQDYLMEQVRMKKDEEARSAGQKTSSNGGTAAANVEDNAAEQEWWQHEESEELNALGKGYGKGYGKAGAKGGQGYRGDWNPWGGKGGGKHFGGEGGKGQGFKGGGKGFKGGGKGGGGKGEGFGKGGWGHRGERRPSWTSARATGEAGRLREPADRAGQGEV